MLTGAFDPLGLNLCFNQPIYLPFGYSIVIFVRVLLIDERDSSEPSPMDSEKNIIYDIASILGKILRRRTPDLEDK